MDNDIVQFAMMSSFQSNPISVEDARKWLQQIIPQIIPVAGSVFNHQIDLYKLIRSSFEVILLFANKTVCSLILSIFITSNLIE